MYIFVRKDLSESQRVVQATHAGIESTRQFAQGRHPRLVVIGIKNEAKLLKIEAELKVKGINVTRFVEEDGSTTALATESIFENRKHLFKRFMLL